MRITIGLGGSVINPREPDTSKIKEITEALSELKEKGHEVLVVTGGGQTARNYIQAGEKFEAPHTKLDRMGISATRLNARLLICALGKLAEPEPPHNFEKAIRTSLKNKIPVMGGTKPGHTTDAVAAELANTSNSDLLIFLTDVDGVYTADPKKDKKAEKITEMKTSELHELMAKMKFKPGMTAIIDPLAAEVLQQTRIKTLVLGEEEIPRLTQIVNGESHSGTEILPSD